MQTATPNPKKTNLGLHRRQRVMQPLHTKLCASTRKLGFSGY